MSATRLRQRHEAETRIAALEAANPEWRLLLGVLRETLALLQDRAPRLSLELEPGAPSEPARPLLHGAAVRITTRWPAKVAKRLAHAAGIDATPQGERGIDTRQAFALLNASLKSDRDGLDLLAQATAIEARRLGVIGSHAVIPLLAACARVQPPQTADWLFGHCPFCGAWPVLGEVRGIEQARRLRCGRCAADWPGEWLRCVFCGEDDHMRLGSLVPEGRTVPGRVDACSACGGYLKVLNTLTPISPFELELADLESVELDLVARGRGFTRPRGLGYPLVLRATVF